MKHLQLKYNLLHIFYWAASCALMGYVAVFLQYKGFTNTEIGIVTGGGCFAVMFLSPFISQTVVSKGLSTRKLMTLFFLLSTCTFLLISFINVPALIIMILYILQWCLIVSSVPFLSMLCMDYIQAGEDLNFGLSRGLGSVSYAISAVVLGMLVKGINPNILVIFFGVSAIIDLVLLYSLPVEKKKYIEKKEEEKQGNILTIITKYKIFFFLLLGFTFMFAASTTLSTYLINIVKRLGGDTSLYGVGIFLMASSEMPVMAIAPRLIKRYNSILLIMVAAVFYILRNFLICLAPALPVLFLGMLMQGFSYGLFTAVITYYVTYHLKKPDQMMGQTMIGIMSSGLGSMIGNVLGGVLQDQLGITAMFIFACSITVLGVVIIWMTGFTQKKDLFRSDRLRDL